MDKKGTKETAQNGHLDGVVRSIATTVDLKNTEIFDQPWKMWAEGTSIFDLQKPLESCIYAVIESQGFKAKNIEIWFDDMQMFYRWNCDIEKP